MTPLRGALALLLLGVLAAPAVPPPAADATHERARTVLMLHVVEALDLPEDQALALRAVFRRADERRAELTAKRAEALERVRGALAHPPVDDVALAKLTEESAALERDLAAVPTESFREAQKLLTVQQQAKLLLLRSDLQGRVNEAMQRRLRRGAATKPAEPHRSKP